MAKVLAKSKNQSETVRKALELYHSDITTDTLEDIKKSYRLLLDKIKDMDSKLDYLAAGPLTQQKIAPTATPYDIVSSSAVPMTAENPMQLAHACCVAKAPCKHWSWDINTGNGYINSLTGELRETL